MQMLVVGERRGLEFIFRRERLRSGSDGFDSDRLGADNNCSANREPQIKLDFGDLIGQFFGSPTEPYKIVTVSLH
jgi:hypothetical protein